MGSYVADLPKLHIETPCIRSHELSQAAGCNIYLKLENLQPSGSFKSRGVGALMAKAMLAAGGGQVRFYCSSGGNAGLACAEAARTLRRPCDVFVSTLSPTMVLDKLAALGAVPHRIGKDWPEADAHCRAAAAADPTGVYVPPFDDPAIWQGNGTLVDELVALEANRFFPGNGDGEAGLIDAIVCSVGGGGLLNGIMQSIERNYAPDPPRGSPSSKSRHHHHHHRSSRHSRSSSGGSNSSSSSSSGVRHRPAVLAVETAGADSLAACVRAGSHVGIPGITSIAVSLGAPRVSERTYQWAEACHATSLTFTATSTSAFSSTFGKLHTNTGSSGLVAAAKPESATRLVSAVVGDADAVNACARFLDDARMLVEPACGATLAAVYARKDGGLLRAALAPDADDRRWATMNVVLVVCGGSGISANLLARYRRDFGV
ncbi:tryptophan synthase beta subunit-like PLP-dependent enzyme [Nemania sp. FL0916]|nr:tryptophan synthase beta subunit-like PLP-dependent enzyme [Nemania sp. FL0916]